MSFEGKTALVTGASSGLGAATVRQLAAQGACVYAASRDQQKLAEVATSCADLPGTVAIGYLDVANPASCREAVVAATALHDRLDVLVNNAGRHDFRITTEVTDEQWDHDIATNLSGAFHCARAAIPYLVESGGAIVNVSSVAGQIGEAYSAAYTAAKHGIVGLTKALAVEYVKTPLRVNCVCPGGMDTAQVHTIDFPPDADFELIMRVAATRGFMSPESVAETVVFLASDAARSINGGVLVVDQGHSAG